MAKKPKAADIAKITGAAQPLRARPIHDLDPHEADRQVAMYEAALRGDNAEFVRLRDAG